MSPWKLSSHWESHRSEQWTWKKKNWIWNAVWCALWWWRQLPTQAVTLTCEMVRVTSRDVWLRLSESLDSYSCLHYRMPSLSYAPAVSQLKVENKSQSASIKDLTKRVGDLEAALGMNEEISEKIMSWQVAAQVVEGIKFQCFSQHSFWLVVPVAYAILLWQEPLAIPKSTKARLRPHINDGIYSYSLHSLICLPLCYSFATSFSKPTPP